MRLRINKTNELKDRSTERISLSHLDSEIHASYNSRSSVFSNFYLIRNFAEYIAKEGGPNDFVEGSVAQMRRRFLGFDEKMRESGKTDHQRQPTSPKGLTTTLGQDAKVGLTRGGRTYRDCYVSLAFSLSLSLALALFLSFCLIHLQLLRKKFICPCWCECMCACICVCVRACVYV